MRFINCLLLLVIVCTTGCSSTHKSFGSSNLSTKLLTTSVPHFEVGSKVEGSVTMDHYFFGIFSSEPPFEFADGVVVSEAATVANSTTDPDWLKPKGPVERDPDWLVPKEPLDYLMMATFYFYPVYMNNKAAKKEEKRYYQEMLKRGVDIFDLYAKLKNAAAFKALEGSNYDYILNPRYSIKRSGSFLHVKEVITIEGHGLNINEFRKMPDTYYY